MPSVPGGYTPIPEESVLEDLNGDERPDGIVPLPPIPVPNIPGGDMRVRYRYIVGGSWTTSLYAHPMLIAMLEACALDLGGQIDYEHLGAARSMEYAAQNPDSLHLFQPPRAIDLTAVYQDGRKLYDLTGYSPDKQSFAYLMNHHGGRPHHLTDGANHLHCEVGPDEGVEMPP